MSRKNPLSMSEDPCTDVRSHMHGVTTLKLASASR
jgi:hypothetical protein